MKKLILSLSLLFVAVGFQAQEIQWLTMDEALEAQQKQPKKIVMDVYTSWCGPCKMMDKNTFSNKNVAQYINEHFYPVKFNAEGEEIVHFQDYTFTNPKYVESKKGRNARHQFTTAMQIQGYPSLVFFDESGNILTPLPGYVTPRQIEVYLKMFAQDDFKDITSAEEWKDYERQFENKF